MSEELPKRRDKLIVLFFGLCDLSILGVFIPLIPKFYSQIVSDAGLPRLLALCKILVLISAVASGTGHLLRRKWGVTLFFIQVPFRLLTNIFTLSALLYLIPYIGDIDVMAGIHMSVVAFEWLRLFLSFRLRRLLAS
jgi:hypothetical protein